MRYVFLFSGVCGFVLVAGVGYFAERPFDLVLRDAALACLASALVGRWFWSVLDRAFASTMEVRRAAAEAAHATEEATKEAAKGAINKTTASLSTAATKQTPTRPSSASATATGPAATHR
jgi:hypothetical protein